MTTCNKRAWFSFEAVVLRSVSRMHAGTVTRHMYTESQKYKYLTLTEISRTSTVPEYSTKPESR